MLIRFLLAILSATAIPLPLDSPLRDGLESFVGGAVDEVQDIAKGTANAVLHPFKALKRIGQIARHPIYAASAVKESLSANWKADKMNALGHVATTVAMIVVPLPKLYDVAQKNGLTPTLAVESAADKLTKSTLKSVYRVTRDTTKEFTTEALRAAGAAMATAADTIHAILPATVIDVAAQASAASRRFAFGALAAADTAITPMADATGTFLQGLRNRYRAPTLIPLAERQANAQARLGARV